MHAFSFFLQQVYMGALNGNCVTLLCLDMLLNVHTKLVLNHSDSSYTLTARKYSTGNGKTSWMCFIWKPLSTVSYLQAHADLDYTGSPAQLSGGGGGVLYHIKVTFPEALWRGERPLALSHYIKSASITPIKGFFFIFKNQSSGSKLSSTQDLNDLWVLCVWSGTPVRLQCREICDLLTPLLWCWRPAVSNESLC